MNTALRQLLQQTSRSFHLTLRVLPAAVRSQIGLAYLLARTSDTIADTEALPVTQRLEALQGFRERLLGTRTRALELDELVQQQAEPVERRLLQQAEVAIAYIRLLSSADQQRVLAVLKIITSGQEQDLRRFAGANSEAIVALQTDAELEDYTYRVAGCVGEFWSQMCRAHLFPTATLDEPQWLADGVRFGKGLQLVNILRDLPVDLRNGRCYLPLTRLAQAGLSPTDLLRMENASRVRPIYQHWLDSAEAHLAAGWSYTNALPRGQVRVRLACAWPILIGSQTLARLREANVLDPTHRIKVSRSEVRRILWRSVWTYPFPRKWTGLFRAGKALSGKVSGKAVASVPDIS